MFLIETILQLTVKILIPDTQRDFTIIFALDNLFVYTILLELNTVVLINYNVSKFYAFNFQLCVLFNITQF